MLCAPACICRWNGSVSWVSCNDDSTIAAWCYAQDGGGLHEAKRTMESGTSLKSRPKVCSGLAGASAAPSVHKAFYVARRRRRRSLTQFGQPYYRQPRGPIRSFPRHQVKLSSLEFNGRLFWAKRIWVNGLPRAFRYPCGMPITRHISAIWCTKGHVPTGQYRENLNRTA